MCRECPAGCGVLARNRDGRVVKLEGNPDHPVNRGALCVRGQAALQGLYHPDRFAGPQRREGNALRPLAWDDALKLLSDKLAAARGANKGRAIALVSQLENGSLGALLDRFTQALGAPSAADAGAVRLRGDPGRAIAPTFGRDAVPYHAFEDAEVILNFGADFVETWINNVHYARRLRAHARLPRGPGGDVHPRRAAPVAHGRPTPTSGCATRRAPRASLALADPQAAGRRAAWPTSASARPWRSVDVKKVADGERRRRRRRIKHVAEAFGRGKPEPRGRRRRGGDAAPTRPRRRSPSTS